MRSNRSSRDRIPIAINPLNWRTDDVKADAGMNKGAVFFDGKNRIISEDKNFCSAVVNPETGALIVVPAKKERMIPSLWEKESTI